jgi:alpha-tubulin suppressor-like RCC1 family protein
MTRITWSTAVSCVALIATVACDSTSDPSTVADDSVNITGLWDVTGVLIVTSRVVVCSDTGSIRFVQDGETFTASGSGITACRGLLQDYGLPKPLAITDGEIVDSFISFTLVGVCGCDQAGCEDARYVGTVHSDPPRMVGSSACSVNFDGDWEAKPAAPVASFELELDSIGMVIGEQIFLDPVLRTASGTRVFERSVEWSSSDPSLVSVDSSGAVDALDAGQVAVAGKVGEGIGDEVVVRSRWLDLSSVEVGLFHSCGLGSDQTTYCWGANDVGQSGPAPSLLPCPGVPCRRAPSAVPSTKSFTKLSPGFQSTCGLAADGLAYCWGTNSAGQLGSDSTVTESDVPVAVSGGLVFESLSVGTNHACGVTSAGAAYCWGANNLSQLGSPKETVSHSPVPLAVSGGVTFSSVVTGELHSCGLDPEGVAFCWGWNWWGQLGNDSIEDSAVPLRIPGGVAFESLTSGAHHICGLSRQGKAYCWGRGREGQLGVEPGEFGFNTVPEEVTPDLIFQSLDAGALHTCGVAVGGKAYCWGSGRNGRLGGGNAMGSLLPIEVVGGLVFSSVSAGQEHTCGATTTGLVYCWGSNFNGQLGILELGDFDTPQLVIGQPR